MLITGLTCCFNHFPTRASPAFPASYNSYHGTTTTTQPSYNSSFTSKFLITSPYPLLNSVASMPLTITPTCTVLMSVPPRAAAAVDSTAPC